MTSDELDDRLGNATAIIRKAGRLALDHFTNRAALTIEHKGRQDLVSLADRAVEELIRNELARHHPGEAVLGEEGGGGEAERVWVIDPIDGTFNFLKGLPCWAVVLAYVVNGRTMVSLTYDPVHDELWAARRDGGATLNGRAVRVSGLEAVDTACLALAYTFKQPRESYVRLVDRALAHGLEHRRMGSTAVQLAWVADGRCDGFITLRCSSWDALAGLLLVEEAGGAASDFVALHGLLGAGGVYAATPGLASLLADLSGLPVPASPSG